MPTTEVSVVQAFGGPLSLYPIRFMTRGRIRRLLVKQIAGDLSGFTYRLFSSAAAVVDPLAAPLQLSAEADRYAITPLLTVAATKDSFQGTWPFDGINNLDLAFANQDSKNSNVARGVGDDSNREQRVWLLLDPVAINGTFLISLAGTSDY